MPLNDLQLYDREKLFKIS